MSNEEEKKLVAFFRSKEGDELGRDGDHDNLSPAETAIRAMRKLISLESQPLPEGMVAVPVEPTQAMVDAVLTTIHEREDKYLRERVRADYRAMLAAAKESKP